MLAPAMPERPVQPQSQQWTCARCGRVLGVVRGKVVVIQHEQRKITAHLPCDQECDRCQHINHREH
jgi:hypothetical protein